MYFFFILKKIFCYVSIEQEKFLCIKRSLNSLEPKHLLCMTLNQEVKRNSIRFLQRRNRILTVKVNSIVFYNLTFKAIRSCVTYS